MPANRLRYRQFSLRYVPQLSIGAHGSPRGTHALRPAAHRPPARVVMRLRAARRPTFVLAALVVAWIAVIGGLSWFLAGSQSSSRGSLSDRMQARTELGAEFASLYVSDLISRERREAMSWLARDEVRAGSLHRAAAALQVQAAALFDQRGRLLASTLARSRPTGRNVADPFADLAAGLTRAGGVSDAIDDGPGRSVMVAVEAPFRDAGGAVRVLAGAYPVSQSPLDVYLEHLIVTPGRRVYLLDAQGAVIAGTSASSSGTTLTRIEPGLATAIGRVHRGQFDGPHGMQIFDRTPVAGTPWQVVVAAPRSQLFASVDRTFWLAWGGVAGFALAGLLALVLVARLSRSRRRLVVLNRELAQLAHVDPLTGLKNRRALEESLQEALSDSRRHDQELSLLLIDVDHFKELNDTHGHRTGDEVLRQVAQGLHGDMRAADVIGRWGGEEFLVILPRTDGVGALESAERLRSLVSGMRMSVGETEGLALTVTVGMAQWGGEGAEDLIDRADAALYAGKAAGRNVVRAADPRSRRTAGDLIQTA
jgi:diguanylate cyclase (GGDEF)-like protein